MIVFALDSAGKTAGVGIWQNDALLYESYLAAGHTHSETLLPLCDAAFSATGLTPAAVDLFAVNAGPGSFTGLRIGLAAVKGLAFPTGALCAPVSTLEALAFSMQQNGICAAALDARRGEVYCAAFACQNGNVTRLLPDATLPAAQFAHRVAALGGPVFCMGDGASLVSVHNDTFTLMPAHWRNGRISGVCLAALQAQQAGQCVSACQLSPEYHRLSQAERERAAREKERI